MSISGTSELWFCLQGFYTCTAFLLGDDDVDVD